MLRNMLYVTVTAALAWGLAACDTDDDRDTRVETPETTTVEPADITAGPGTPPIEQPYQTEEEVGPLLTVSRSGEIGEYLADAAGRPLYALMGEKDGMKDCTGACLGAWPPLVATDGEPFADSPQLNAELIGTDRQSQGTEQVTYNGWPLYYYAEQLGPGHDVEATEHDQWGMWHLVSPDGELMSGNPSAAARQSAAQASEPQPAPAEDDDG